MAEIQNKTDSYAWMYLSKQKRNQRVFSFDIFTGSMSEAYVHDHHGRKRFMAEPFKMYIASMNKENALRKYRNAISHAIQNAKSTSND